MLNAVEKYSGFVYSTVRLVGSGGTKELEVMVRPRAGSKAICSGCDQPRPGYDMQPEHRRFEYVPLWGVAVFFLYCMRRVDCPTCNVRVEKVPWAIGKSRMTTSYAWFLAIWAKRMSWKAVADAFHTTWDNVFSSVAMAVEWGRAHVDLSGVKSIGVDEISWKHGQKYLTLVYQIDVGYKRLLWIGQERTEATLRGFFTWFGTEKTAALKFVCSDMWRPYLKVIAQKAGQALHILDRFHIMAHISKAIDKVRAEEVRSLKAKGLEPVLKDSRWVFLKRPENLTDKQDVKLADLVSYNLRTVRSYLLKEEFQSFWEYVSPGWAGRFLEKWCTKVMRSRIEPMKKIAKMLRNHHPLILNWFKAKGLVSSGSVEGLNNKARITTRRAFGFRTYQAAEIALYHTLGELPEPELTHRFA